VVLNTIGHAWFWLVWDLALVGAMIWLTRFNYRRIQWIRGPEEVTIRRPDGTDVPCDIVYHSMDEKGMKTWWVANRTLRPGDEIRVKNMPYKTKLIGEWDDG
jgi:hypothetical protein